MSKFSTQQLQGQIQKRGEVKSHIYFLVGSAGQLFLRRKDKACPRAELRLQLAYRGAKRNQIIGEDVLVLCGRS